MKFVLCLAIPLAASLGCATTARDAAIGYTDHYLERLERFVVEWTETADAERDAGSGIDWTTVAGGVIVILTGLGVTTHQARDRRKFHNGGKR